MEHRENCYTVCTLTSVQNRPEIIFTVIFRNSTVPEYFTPNISVIKVASFLEYTLSKKNQFIFS